MIKQVALIGFAFRLPGGSSTSFWEELLAGRDLISAVDPERWSQDAFLHPQKSNPGTSYTFAAGSIGDTAGFDAPFFGISPREAAFIDPQQRLLLELCWEAFENAGIPPMLARKSRCGVYIGISTNDYMTRFADDLGAIDASLATGGTASIAANRISYTFDLQGPSMAIDTACSSALVAFHQACRAILAGECTQALAGGVNLHLHPSIFISFSKATMLSRDGRCKVFDAEADGYVRSEGGGIFFLKDYARAVADGDPILAVVAGTGVNTDGRKTGMTIPSADIQAQLFSEVCQAAGLSPGDIDYVEAHGTGTKVGDPIETRALGMALGKRRAKNRPLPIGSVKSNVGHLEAAAGVAGLVKALYSLQHRIVPATIGINTPNPAIKLDEWNLELVTSNRALGNKRRLVVGVNAFGFGGANAHVLLTTPPPRQRPKKRRTAHQLLPLVLSASTADNLPNIAREMADFLAKSSPADWYDITWHATHRREWLPHRLVTFAGSREDAAYKLQEFAANPEASSVTRGTALGTPGGMAFVYSGNGAQWAGMGAQLLTDRTFLAAVREVDRLFRTYADFSLEAELAGRNGADRYQATEIAQPALFAIQVGITRMLQQRGLKPAAVAGHSVGEIAAAWAAGILTLPQAVAVIFHRSHLQATTRGAGQMTAVAMSGADAQVFLNSQGFSGQLSVAGCNSAKAATVAGPVKALTRFETLLAQEGIAFKRLDLDYAFHSPAMNGIRQEIGGALSDLVPAEAEVPFYSTVSGSALSGQTLTADYWWQNVRKPVRFDQAIQAMIAEGNNIFVEIGPHAILRHYLNDALQSADCAGTVIATGLRDNDGPGQVLAAADKALLAGANFDWGRYFSAPGQFVQFPNYPWQRERHWHPTTPASIGLLSRHKTHPLLGYRLAQHELTWENQIDTALQPMLADHVVGNATVFPGAGYVEMALAAATDWQGQDLIGIENLEIRAPLLLDNQQAKVVRLGIDPQSGSFSIKGRDLVGETVWGEFAAGRILPPSSCSLPANRTLEVPTRRPDFDTTRHAKVCGSLGLHYGQTFQSIRHGWIEGTTITAELQTPPGIAHHLPAYRLHPAFLDAAFQLIAQLPCDDRARTTGLVFIPARIGQIVVSGTAVPSAATVELRKRSPHSLSADVYLFDRDGSLVAYLRDARFQGLRLKQSPDEQIKSLAYKLSPQSHPQAPQPVQPDLDTELQSIMSNLARVFAASPMTNLYAGEVEPLLDLLCSHFGLEALQAIAKTDGSLPPVPEVVNNPALRNFYRDLCRKAEAEGLIDAGGDNWRLRLIEQPPPSALAIWQRLVDDYPDFFAAIHTVGRIGTQLTSLLGRGDNSTESYFPTSLAPLFRQTLGHEGLEIFRSAIRDVLDLLKRQLPASERLGVVEISEGPSLFHHVLSKSLDPNCSDYLFLSNSSEAIETIQLEDKDDPSSLFVQTSRLDQAASAMPAASCRLALVVNDFVSIDTAQMALDQAKRLLYPGGVLLLVGFHPCRWLDFALGETPGWWRDSGTLSPKSPQAAEESWAAHLKQLGFAPPIRPASLSEIHSGPFLLAAQLHQQELPEDVEAPRTLLILTDSRQSESALLRQLRSKGASDRLIFSTVDDPQHFEQAVSASYADTTRLDGIVWFAPGAEEHQDFLSRQVDRCWSAALLLRAAEKLATDTPCWLITTGVATALFANQRQQEDFRPSLLEDAALWGFGRTLLNEAATPLRLIDLDPAAAPDQLAESLLRELCAPTSEQEIFLTASAGRQVPRLTEVPRYSSSPAQQEDHETSRIRLVFDLPGQLRNLYWTKETLAAIGPEQLKVEVAATGLNFRDLMYTLGLLSDEAVENGFAGASLGLEFAGTIRHVGRQVSGLNCGDRVVGFNSGCFSSRMIADARTVVKIPEGMSFEAAATIPTTFLTAYYALKHLANVRKGERVLIHSAAGGVGLAAIQIAHWCGAEVHATAGTEEKRDFLLRLGVAAVYDSHSLAFAEELLARNGGTGVDVVLNSLAGDYLHTSLGVLRPFGRFLELGKRDFYANTRLGLRPFRNNISYFGIDADQLLQKRQELAGELFQEVMALFTAKQLHPLPYRSFNSNEAIEAFRYMQQGRQIGKIVVSYGENLPKTTTYLPPGDQPGFDCHARASYLVTGGLRGFGLRTAQWLTSRGARHLILAGRSLPTDDETQSALEQLHSQGVKVLPACCDITDRQAVACLLETITTQGFPPLRGVAHAAAAIDDGLARNLSKEQLARVLAPKIQGAWNLHELTRSLSLDFFVFFSSATTLFGNPGQGNYVAANLWLEGLARQRRLAGLPATCIGWGPIDDVGYLARNTKVKDNLQKRLGGAPLFADKALDVLGQSLAYEWPEMAILHCEWSALSRYLPTAETPKFANFARRYLSVGNDGSFAEHDFPEMLQRLGESEFSNLVSDLVKKEVSGILRLPAEKIDSNRHLHDFGFDSLMGVELVVAIEARFGIKLSVLGLNDNLTIAKLSERIVAGIKAGKSVEESPSDLPQQLVGHLASQHASELSAEQIIEISSVVKNNPQTK